MERIIPKNSKVKFALFKRFTMLDLAIACVMFAVALLIFFSDFENRLIWCLVYIAVCVTMFIGDDEDKTYNELAYLVRYFTSRRTYIKDAKRGNTDDLIPFKNITDEGIIEYDGYYGGLIEVGSVDFGLLDEEEQDRRIAAFARVLNGLGHTSVIQLVKIDRPIKYDEVSARLFEKLKRAEEEDESIKAEILKSRLEQIDNINNVHLLYRPCYYIALFENNVDALFGQIDACRNGLDDAGLYSTFLNAREAAVFFKYCYTHDFDERDVEEVDVSELADYVKPDKVKFGLSGYTVDDVYAFTLAVKEYPLYVNNAWGADIFNIDNTKVVLTIKPVDKGKSIKRIDRAVQELITHNAGKLSEQRSQDTHIHTMNDLQARIQNENEMLFDCTLTVTGLNNGNIEKNAFRKDVRRQLTDRKSTRLNSSHP